MVELIEMVLQREKTLIDYARRVEIEKRLDLYHDNYKLILQNEIDNQFHKSTRGNVKQMIDDSSNVLKRIINEISLVYKQNAVRSYKVNDEDDERYKEILDQMPVDLTMQEVNRKTNLCNECLIYIVPRNDKIDYDIITPDKVEVYQHREDPTKPAGIMFSKAYVDTINNTKIRKVYWDIEGQHMIYDEHDNVLENLGNPYTDINNPEKTILPFVIFHKNYMIDSIWDRTSGNDLVSGTIQIGVLLTYLNYLMKVGSFKMLTFTGIDIKDIPQDLIFDPLFAKVIKDPSGQIGTVDLQLALNVIWEIIYNKIGALANNYGLSLDNFKLTADAQSGYALKIKNLGIENIIEGQRKFYRYYENELFEKTKIVNNTIYKDKQIKDGGIFRIDFAETEYPESPFDIREQWLFDIKMGAKSIFDYVKFVNPDIKNDEDAEKVISQNVEINNMVNEEYGISIDKLLESAFKQNQRETSLIK